MARPEIFSYALRVNQAALGYFPSGLREGKFMRLPVDSGFGIGEYAPLACLSAQQRYSAMDFLASYARIHAQIKSEARHLLAGLTVKLSALVSEQDADMALACAQNHLAQGYQSLKIKVFPGCVEREIKKITSIDRLADSRVALRLDANGSLSLDEARVLIRGIQMANIDYFEEPVRGASAMDRLAADCDINLAADESFWPTMNLDHLPKKIRYLVLKPGCFKDVSTLINVAKQAQALGISPILSTCFESEFLTGIFAMLAFRLNLLDCAHGIFEPHFFNDRVLDEPLAVKNGHLDLAHTFDLLKNFDLRDQPWLTTAK